MRLIYSLLTFIFLSVSCFSKIPATEVRAVWLTTNWGLDWPKQGTSTAAQKEQLRKILDELQADNINTVLFQARAQGSVLYRSSIEPLSPYFSKTDGFDPLAFAIEECHKRGMECHAWLITFPMGQAQMTGTKKKRTAVKNKPDYYKLINTQWYLDPGRPEARALIVSIVKEIVQKYDVDGVHFDYIRYPSNTRKFPDDDTYKKYGNGKSLYDWRRDNINKLVTDIYDTTKAIKNWVQVSSSPLGRYRVLSEIAPNDGWTGYETVFQDAGYWMKSGKHDLVFPMMYHKERYFYPFLDDWVANSNGRLVVPGLGIYQMMSNEQNWELQNITDQMNYTRITKVPGQAYFRTGNILNNLKGVRDSIQTFYPYPAKLPALTWLDNEAPNAPINLQVYKDNSGSLNINWEAPDNSEDFTYTVYVSYEENVNKDDPRNILATGIRGNNFSFPVSEGDFGIYYTVSVSDRYHNESITCFPAFFSHAANEQ
ncbi:glycoside hydrolase family 10 protein [Dysgonomonas sp. ZJ279]|uniref:glycoside hydrolase family 10 protein n=1 Tax=Dysgonomonas sp. ZJ279 TaxID=2709796 RepID=UPI0013ED97F9|nr:family 10 glycosylhydrolase [Dysgonomonas sp. ZJ279]